MALHIYRNLHKKCWSVRENGRVVEYRQNITLKDCVMRVSKKGRQRVLKERRKNIHAYVSGKRTNKPKIKPEGEISYNPYKYPYFFDVKTKIPIFWADYVWFNENKVYYY